MLLPSGLLCIRYNKRLSREMAAERQPSPELLGYRQEEGKSAPFRAKLKAYAFLWAKRKQSALLNNPPKVRKIFS
jgi:hypothetical protein